MSHAYNRNLIKIFLNSNLNWNNIQQHETKQCKISVDEILIKKNYYELLWKLMNFFLNSNLNWNNIQHEKIIMNYYEN